MTLVTGVVVDSTGKKDSREWKVWSPVYAESATGDVVSTRVRTINVTAGIFRAIIDPGVVVLENPDGMAWTVTIPETDMDLWDLIELAAGLPPETPQSAIRDVVWEYLEDHPIEAGPQGDPGEDGAPGASAYQVAVANGFVGSQGAWLASLIGPQGIQGIQGIQGVPGADGAGAGDMTKAVYDPGNKNGNAFSQDNMVDGSTNKNYTATEKTKLSGIASGATVYTNSDADARIAAASATGTGSLVRAASPTFTGTVAGITKSMVGLGSVDNTADTAKPVSSAQQSALDLKAPLASPTFTGTVSGVTKAHVGLGSVDNTADTAKPVSTAQQTALDLKAPLASPTFTGTVSGVTKAHVGLGSVDNTADAAKAVLSATKLTTARNINGVSFDGSANVILAPQTVAVTNTAAPSIALTSPFATLTDSALATAVTSVTVTGSPADGYRLMLRFKDAGSTQTITLGASFRAMGVTIPTATTAGKWLQLGCVYNGVDSIFDVVAVAVQA